MNILIHLDDGILYGHALNKINYQKFITQSDRDVLASFASYDVLEHVVSLLFSFYRKAVWRVKPAKYEHIVIVTPSSPTKKSNELCCFTLVYLNIGSSHFFAIKSFHSNDSTITILKMYKCIVFNFLNAFHFTIVLKLFLRIIIIS